MIMHKITQSEFQQLLETHRYSQLYINVVNANVQKLGHPKNRNKSQRREGYEIHHIIPRSFGGGLSQNNLVYLSYYEHILAHYYLALITDNVHMYHSFNLMTCKRYSALSDLEKIQLEELKNWTEVMKLSKKRTFSEEGRKKISTKAKQRWQDFKETGRIEEVKANISKTTAEGMASSIKSQVRTRINLGCKKYWNPETGERRNWYPGMPEFESPWIRGRGPMKPKAKQKLKDTFSNNKHHWYYNDELQWTRTFNESEQIPEGWKRGMKKEYRGNYKAYKDQSKLIKLQELQSNFNLI